MATMPTRSEPSARGLAVHASSILPLGHTDISHPVPPSSSAPLCSMVTKYYQTSSKNKTGRKSDASDDPNKKVRRRRRRRAQRRRRRAGGRLAQRSVHALCHACSCLSANVPKLYSCPQTCWGC